ncbi:HDIG domain-containing protein [Candidatus Poribacteria bacterium]|nr:HDIG domain-containing protein [Candidatus Poribacteria bacterium]
MELSKARKEMPQKFISQYTRFRRLRTEKGAAHLLFARIKVQWWLTGLLFTIILSWIALPNMIIWTSIRLEDFPLEKESPYRVISPATIIYNDEEAVRKEIEQIKLNVPLVYDLEKEEPLKDITQMFATVNAIRADLTLTTDTEEDKNFRETIERLKSELIIGDFLSNDTLTKLATATTEEISAIEKNVKLILAEILSHGVVRNNEANSFADEISTRLLPRGEKWLKNKEKIENEEGRVPTDAEIAQEMEIELLEKQGDNYLSRRVLVKELYNLDEAKAKVTNAVATELVAVDNTTQTASSILMVVEEICQSLIRPNLSYNEDMTERRRTQQAASISSDVTIKEGETIITKGEKITPMQRRKLMAIQPFLKSSSIEIMAGISSIMAFLIGLIVFYLRRYEPNVFQESRKVVVLIITILITAIASRLIIMYSIPYPFLLIPAVIASSMIAILISPQLAVLTTIILGIIVGIISGINTVHIFERLTLVFCGGIVSVLSLSSSVRCRRDVMKAGLYVCIASILIIVGTSLAQDELSIELAKNSLWGVISGIAIIIAIPGLLPVFEYLAKVPTNIQLLELADLEHSLLKELEYVTRGTYHHSINVSKLAETAAEAIEANALLSRVCAYYHDIGKMERPEYFSENQENGDNIHDTIDPLLSARIIKAHVINGVKKAQKHRLPKVIEQVISQHHGTTMVSFFYEKALAEENRKIVEEEDFRYNGPKPQSKEAAIIMLADSVEAASRSMMSNLLEPPTYKELRELVGKVINKKIDDSQMDESGLTLGDIKQIAESFTQVLNGIYHSRVVYPEEKTVTRQKSSTLMKEVISNDRNQQVY